MSVTALAFLFFYAILLIAALLRHPIFGLLAYLAAFYLHPPSRWWGVDLLPGFRWALVAAVITIIGILIHQTGRSAKPLFSFKIVWLLVAFVIWVSIQSAWALAPDKHADFLEMYFKFILVIFVVYRAIDSEQHLRWFLWAHVLGCVYLSWIALTAYSGGRFDDFGGPGISDANSAANQLVTAALIGGSLLLIEKPIGKLMMTVALALVVNGIATTGSRSGFLAFVTGGFVYYLFTPKPARRVVKVLSVIGLAGLIVMAGPTYLQRLATLKERGANVEGADTGYSRLQIIDAQWQMFEEHPLGCGHRCTGVLSYKYMPDELFEGLQEGQGRTSHNTFMTLLVEQGVPGGIFYGVMLAWAIIVLRQIYRSSRDENGVTAKVLPAIAAALAAVFVGDMFVDLLKHEVRIWLIAIVLVLFNLRQTGTVAKPAPSVEDGRFSNAN